MSSPHFGRHHPTGSSWSLILRRGRELRLEDLDGGANVAAVSITLTARSNATT